MNGENDAARVENALPPPPYTETDHTSSSSARTHGTIDAGASQFSPSTIGDPIFTPPASPVAGCFFETRPAPVPAALPSQQQPHVHYVLVRPDSGPDDVPYSPELAARDVTEQDWATFRNYLLPDHINRQNRELADRKLRDEAQSEAGLSTSSSKSHAEAQLEHIRGSSEGIMDAGKLRNHAYETVKEWNSEFFNPRGVTISMETELERDGPAGQTMPGAWDPSFEGSGERHGRGGWRRHFDRVKVSDNALRIGDRFLADVNGLKIGSLTMDGYGIRMDGSQPQPFPSTGAGAFRGGAPPGRWPGPFGQFHHGQRGRCVGEDPSSRAKHRSRSCSSSSSSSTSSTDSNLDSLPDHDDVTDAQLPVYADRLKQWVNEPQTVRTRQDLDALRADLRAWKHAGADPAMDRKAMRQQVKALRGQWKLVRREQRRMKRDSKRERRRRRREEKRERRETKRDMRRTEREARREAREQARAGVHGGLRGPGPFHNASPQAFARGVSWGGMFGPQGSFGPNNFASGHQPRQTFPSHHSGPSGPAAGNWPGPFPHQTFPVPFGRQVPHVSLSGSRGVPPGAWPEDQKARPVEQPAGRSAGQEVGVMDAPGRVEQMRELEKELHRKIERLDSLDAGKERQEGEKEIEALVERLDGLRMEADEALALKLSRQ